MVFTPFTNVVPFVPEVEVAKAAAGDITATVIDRNTQDPIPNATVKLICTDDNIWFEGGQPNAIPEVRVETVFGTVDANGAYTLSEADGIYAIESINCINYDYFMVFAEADGYVPKAQYGSFLGGANSEELYDSIHWGMVTPANEGGLGGLMRLGERSGGGNGDDDSLTLSTPTDKSVDAGEAVAVTDLEVVGGDASDTIDMTLYVPQGSLAFGTMTGLTFTGSSTGNNLKFSGTIADINAALETLTYTAGYTTGFFEIEAIIDEGDGSVYRHANGHVYKVVEVPGGISWADARAAAQAYTFPGATALINGYLATIIDADEHEFVRARIDQDGWIGATDDTSVTASYEGNGEGEWFWVTGPEAGTKFWTGGQNGSAVSDQYANWNKVDPSNEPNNAGGGEHCAEIRFTAGGEGRWNDRACDTLLPNYVVEFGGEDPDNALQVKRATFEVEVTFTAGTLYDFSYEAESYMEHETTTYTFEYVISTPMPHYLLVVDFPVEFAIESMVPDLWINDELITSGVETGGGGVNDQNRTVRWPYELMAGDRIRVAFEDVVNPAAGTYNFIKLYTANSEGEPIDVPTNVAPIVITAPQAPFPGEGTKDNPYEVTECFVAEWTGYYTLMNNITDDADVDGNCIIIEANNVVIDGNGFSISEDPANNNNGAAVSVGYDGVAYANLEVKNLAVSGYSIGVDIQEASEVSISNIHISASTVAAINVENVTNITVEDTEIPNTTAGDGITLYSSDTVTIEGNTLSNISGDAIYLGGVSHATVSENSINGAGSDGIDVSDSYNPLLEEDIHSTNITITNNTVSNIDDRAIEIEYLNGGTIANNTLSSADNAIEIDDSNDITVRENILVSEDIVLVTKNTEDILFVENELMGDVWVEVDESTTSNISFNQGTVGNLYRFANGDGAWTVFDIRDTNNNGYADTGSDLPFEDGLSHNSVVLWVGGGHDNHPATTLEPVGGNGDDNGGSSGGGGGSSGSSSGGSSGGYRPSTTQSTTPSSVSDIITQYRNLFITAHNAGIALPSALLTLLGLDTNVSTPIPGLCPRYTFTRDLEFGDEGEDVRALQRFLNCAGFSLATSGPGAPGEETQYFVDRTLSSVIRFQQAYLSDIITIQGLAAPTGIFAEYSRNKAYTLMRDQ